MLEALYTIVVILKNTIYFFGLESVSWPINTVFVRLSWLAYAIFTKQQAHICIWVLAHADGPARRVVLPRYNVQCDKLAVVSTATTVQSIMLSVRLCRARLTTRCDYGLASCHATILLIWSWGRVPEESTFILGGTGVTPCRRKEASMPLPYTSSNCLVVSVQYRLLTDRRTDRAIASTRASTASRGKMLVN